MDIACVTAIWKRRDLERRVLEYWRKLRVDGINFKLVVVGSEGYASMAITPCDATYVEAPNTPLSMKWNYGIQAARLLDVDAVLTFGSDNIINARAIELLVDGLKGVEWVQPDGCWMWDLKTDRTMFCPMDTGHGRIYSARLLDRMGWTLWADEANVKLDSKAVENLIRYRARKREVLKMYERGGVVLDIKSGVNIWSYDEMEALIEPEETDVSADELLAQCGVTDWKEVVPWRCVTLSKTSQRAE